MRMFRRLAPIFLLLSVALTLSGCEATSGGDAQDAGGDDSASAAHMPGRSMIVLRDDEVETPLASRLEKCLTLARERSSHI